MVADSPPSHFSPPEAGPPIPNPLFDVDHGYDEEAAILADMKALKSRAAAHCANADRKRVSTQTTSFLRDVVQHLPENPMQVPAARAAIMESLGGWDGCWTDNIEWKSCSAPDNALPCVLPPLPQPPSAPDAAGGMPPTTTDPPAFASTTPSTPRGQKRARDPEDDDDTYDNDSPGVRLVWRCTIPDGELSATPSNNASNNNNSPSTPFPSPAFQTFAPPESPSPSPSPRKRIAIGSGTGTGITPAPATPILTNTPLTSPPRPRPGVGLNADNGSNANGSPATAATGAAYLSSTFRARRRQSHVPRMSSPLRRFAPLGLQAEDLPTFLDGV
ncbi:hypothetical protein B0H11DRAFT_2295297 [Mycena galericulata]|nr:hypothetical protein B0H11DRAFT_2295297 [Mycena galericulata]